MSEEKTVISVWLFIGALLLIYGIGTFSLAMQEREGGEPLTVAAAPPSTQPANAVAPTSRNGAIWWGMVMLVMGVIYCWSFRPGKQK